jgi:hypothetical protein
VYFDWDCTSGSPRKASGYLSEHAFPFSIIALSDRLLDQSPAEIMRAEVLDRRVSLDLAGRHYFLRVGGRRPLLGRNEVQVSPKTYTDAEPRDLGSIDLHRGFFGALVRSHGHRRVQWGSPATER